ncbi:MAG: hypothetical protein J3R72DRAFT_484911 [Linnemannia gamsii]|nr:MAG: hypothetical protein J3R72DRAFT_484911 [Linnemannia gamsii]
MTATGTIFTKKPNSTRSKPFDRCHPGYSHRNSTGSRIEERSFWSALVAIAYVVTQSVLKRDCSTTLMIWHANSECSEYGCRRLSHKVQLEACVSPKLCCLTRRETDCVIGVSGECQWVDEKVEDSIRADYGLTPDENIIQFIVHLLDAQDKYLPISSQDRHCGVLDNELTIFNTCYCLGTSLFLELHIEDQRIIYLDRIASQGGILSAEHPFVSIKASTERMEISPPARTGFLMEPQE